MTDDELRAAIALKIPCDADLDLIARDTWPSEETMNADALMRCEATGLDGVKRRVTWRHEQPPPKFERLADGFWYECEPDPELAETARTLLNQEWR